MAQGQQHIVLSAKWMQIQIHFECEWII